MNSLAGGKMIPQVLSVPSLDKLKTCAPILHQLRTSLSEQEIVERILRQMKVDYRLVCIEVEGTVHSVAGYRVLENLAYGRFLYVDDLVTQEGQKRKGYARVLMEWLERQARDNGCRALVLDSGVQRFEAHRFYLAQGFDITSHHFVKRW
jgi:GNAT superfamily N-acetyltransferase